MHAKQRDESREECQKMATDLVHHAACLIAPFDAGMLLV